MTDENLTRIHDRLDDIQTSLNKIEIAQGVYGSLQARFEDGLRDMDASLKRKLDVESASKALAKLDADIDALNKNFELGRRVITQYQGDRKFILGIVATVTVIMGAVNGIAVNVTKNYFAELEAKIDKTEAKSRERYEQYLFDSTANANGLNTLREKVLELHGIKK